jgi:D-aminopeptidase
VGHCTVTDGSNEGVQTGVTVIRPHPGNIFRDKVVATCHVINGFGKPFGLIQLAELGQLESPIALTNTLSVPIVADALLDDLLAHNPEIGTSTGSVNPVVAECNDAVLNDLRGRHVRREHVAIALESAHGGPVAQGAVGAGRGVVAFGLKGGIGTASREVRLGDSRVTVAALVLSNLGHLTELQMAGKPVGAVLAMERTRVDPPSTSAGSIVVVLATDAPVDARQLGRLLRRAQNGIARTGPTTASGSGEIVLGFSTATYISHFPDADALPVRVLREDGPLFDRLFEAVTDATEEAILNSLFNAESLRGNKGSHREAFPRERLLDLLDEADRLARSMRSLK